MLLRDLIWPFMALVGLTSSAFAVEPWKEDARARRAPIEKQAIRAAVLKHLASQGLAEVPELDVKYQLKYTEDAIPREYAYHYPAEVRWSVKTATGDRVTGVLEGHFSEPTTSTGGRYFVIDPKHVTVRKMNRTAKARAEYHLRREAESARIRSAVHAWGWQSPGTSRSHHWWGSRDGTTLYDRDWRQTFRDVAKKIFSVPRAPRAVGPRR
jgi:hypothetical protein